MTAVTDTGVSGCRDESRRGYISGCVNNMVRLRIRYEKRGSIRFASHRDLMRAFRRSFASAGIPVSFSQGFNPHPRLSFGPSLRTGWESLDEYMDMLLDVPTPDLTARCNAHLPEGLRILETAALRESVPRLSADVAAAGYELYLAGADVFDKRGAGDGPPPSVPSAGDSDADADPGSLVLQGLESRIRERFTADGLNDSPHTDVKAVSPTILEIRVRRGGRAGGSKVSKEITIEYTSTMYGGKSLFPEDILYPFLGDPNGYGTPMRVVRKSLYVRRAGDYLSPISRAVVEKRI